MLVFPNAKINLGLFVTEKRNDGFHNIESIMVPIRLHDVLEVVESEGLGGISFTSTGLKIGGDPESNLVVKAYRLLQQDVSLPSVDVCLHKVIPMGAGLGGGSADASFFLLALDKLFALGLNDDLLLKYAAILGSDCPFFIKNQSALATGRGEVLKSLSVDLKDKYIVLVHPGIHVGTAWAYSQITPLERSSSLSELIQKDIKEWSGSLVNDFEPVVAAEHPRVGTIRDALHEMGADFAAMSGSGSAVFGLFSKKPEVGDNFKGMFVWQGRM